MTAGRTSSRAGASSTATATPGAAGPTRPLVPDEAERATIDQLLYEMDDNGVSQALVVCAAIEANPDNIEYVAAARERHPGRFHVVADLDCSWSATYHSPGSADRLRALDDRYELAGFTHYLRGAQRRLAAERRGRGLFARCRANAVSSRASPSAPAWQADLRVLARRHPDVPVLCHHLGRCPRRGSTPGLAEVVASAAVPNIYVKASGFHYASERGWDHPWPDALEMLQRIFDAYGPGRLCWGSDFPASTRSCTFRQSLEAVRTHCRFFTPEDLRLVLGGTLREVLGRAAAS